MCVDRCVGDVIQDNEIQFRFRVFESSMYVPDIDTSDAVIVVCNPGMPSAVEEDMREIFQHSHAVILLQQHQEQFRYATYV